MAPHGNHGVLPFGQNNSFAGQWLKIMSYREIPGSLKAFCNVTILTSWVVEAAEVWGKERRKPSFNAIREREGHSLDGAVKASIVGRHEGQNVEFPIQCGVVDECGQVLGDGLLADLSLAVALWVVAGRGQVANVQGRKQMFHHFVGEFLALVSNQFEMQSKMTHPPI
jgi:hypothetical protein